MGKTLRSKWGLLVLAAALVVGMATIPAVGEHTPESSDVLRLHMGADGNYFQLEPISGSATTQSFSPQSNCRLNVDGDLVTLSGSSSPGYHNQSIGIRGSGGNGVPCSRVDSNESLTVTLNGGLSAVAVDLDLELKGDTELLIDLSNGEQYIVRSGGKTQGEPGSNSLTLHSGAPAGNCQGGSDSGPDSGPNDNCRVTIDPDEAFTSLTFSLTSGEMSLEGGGDFFPYDPANDTMFYLETWDGLLGCGDSTLPRVDGDVVTEIIRHDNVTTELCTPKLFRLVADANDEQNGSVTFEVYDPADQPDAFFEAYVTFKEDLTSAPPMVGTLEYDPDGSDGYLDFKTMPACTEAPFDGNGDPVASAIPVGHEGCVITVTQDFDGTTKWHAVFMGDWKFR